MLIYFWVACGVVNWYFFLKYIFKHKAEIDTGQLKTIVPYILFFSLLFGAVWTMAIFLYHVGTAFEKNK